MKKRKPLMPVQVKKWGSVALLVTLFSGILITGVNNYVAWAAKQLSAVAPVVVAVDELKAVIIENQKTNRNMFVEAHAIQTKYREDNADQHGELSMMIYNQNSRFSGNEAKLLRVIKDCETNHDDIATCRTKHEGK